MPRRKGSQTHLDPTGTCTSATPPRQHPPDRQGVDDAAWEVGMHPLEVLLGPATACLWRLNDQEEASRINAHIQGGQGCVPRIVPRSTHVIPCEHVPSV